jgi:hypothetical protein
MKITEVVSKSATAGMSEEDALARGIEEKRKGCIEKGTVAQEKILTQMKGTSWQN